MIFENIYFSLHSGLKARREYSACAAEKVYACLISIISINGLRNLLIPKGFAGEAGAVASGGLLKPAKKRAIKSPHNVACYMSAKPLTAFNVIIEMSIKANIKHRRSDVIVKLLWRPAKGMPCSYRERRGRSLALALVGPRSAAEAISTISTVQGKAALGFIAGRAILRDACMQQPGFCAAFIHGAPINMATS